MPNKNQPIGEIPNVKELLEYKVKAHCELCDLKHLDCCNTCIYTAIKQFIELFKRLQAENENLKDILYDAEGVNLVNYWYQQCKIAENGCKNFEEENQSQKSEIERLRNHNDLLMSDIEKVKEKLFGMTCNWDGTFGGIDKIVNELKTEAYKEFAEKSNSIIDSLIEQYSIKDFEEFKAICQVLRGLKNDTNDLLEELV